MAQFGAHFRITFPMGRSDRMISYAAFGLRLDSEFELPELDRSGSDTVAAWACGARFGGSQVRRRNASGDGFRV